jgi:hypothetical protein
MSQIAEVKGLDELIARMSAYPVEYVKTMATGMSASLNVYWENVPPYPQPPPESKYRRTGLLGKSLGSDISGGANGNPSVFKIQQLGGGAFEGTFGTNLDYAPYVIGDTAQAEIHKGRWYVIGEVATKANEKVMKVWQMVADKLAAFLEMKGV